MTKTETPKTTSFKRVDLTYSTAPKTHVFYETEGERAVDPLLMIKDGITLWLEQISVITERDLWFLWAYARNLLAARDSADKHSYIEKIRRDITVGAIVPGKWDRSRAYPYKGLLISAIYLQEAKRLCKEGNTDRVWHVVTMAYYQLGINTSPSITEAASKKAKAKHDRDSVFKRDFVLNALQRVKEDRSADTVSEAIDEVCELIVHSKAATKLLDEIEAQTSSETRSSDAADAVERLRQTLKNWARPDGPYREIWDAFSCFDKTVHRIEPTGPEQEDISWDPLPEDTAHYMRFIGFRGNGIIQTAELMRSPDEEVASEHVE